MVWKRCACVSLLFTCVHAFTGAIPSTLVTGRGRRSLPPASPSAQRQFLCTRSGARSRPLLCAQQEDVSTSPTVQIGPSEETLDLIPVLQRVAVSAKNAVTLATGEGTESSGKGRFEWGTWCDTTLFEAVKTSLNDVLLQGSPELWEELWPNVGGEQEAASIVVARGTDWEIKLHLFMARGSKPDDAPPPLTDSFPTGSLVFLKPLLGITDLRKMRKIGARMVPLGDKIPLKGAAADGDALGGSDVSDYQLLLGGAVHTMAGTSGPSLVLEVGLLPPMGLPQRHNTSLPNMDSSSPALVAAFRSLAARQAQVEAEEQARMAGTRVLADTQSSEPDTVQIKVGGKATQATADKLTAQVGGLGPQLEQIVRRVLVSRADPKAARALGISHVRGILLSGPPGCGKTLLARQLSQALGAREPMIVNGPEILDKFVGEAEKKIRALFAPAEAEWRAAGDASALHVIVLDEFDSIARKRGSLSGDTTGVRDSVVNQLLAKMDGVDTGDNFLVVGLTNRPELLDEALLRPGRLEVHVTVQRPDVFGRRDVLRIHTRAMRRSGALAPDAQAAVEDVEDGLPARTEHFSGAELAGVVRSAASFALARGAAEVEAGIKDTDTQVTLQDLERALGEVPAASASREAALLRRFSTHAVTRSNAHALIMDELQRFVRPAAGGAARREGMLLMAGGSGAGVTALASWAASTAVRSGTADYARIVTMVDLAGASDESARCSALVEAFGEASQAGRAILVLDDVDRMVAGTGPNGASAAVLGTLRALLREPMHVDAAAQAPPMLLVIATTSSGRAGCISLEGVFDSVRAVPLVSTPAEADDVLRGSPTLTKCLPPKMVPEIAAMAVEGGPLGVKSLLMLASRAVSEVAWNVSAGENGAGVEHDEVMRRLVREWRVQEEAAHTSCSVV